MDVCPAESGQWRDLTRVEGPLRKEVFYAKFTNKKVKDVYELVFKPLIFVIPIYNLLYYMATFRIRKKDTKC